MSNKALHDVADTILNQRGSTERRSAGEARNIAAPDTKTPGKIAAPDTKTPSKKEEYNQHDLGK